MLVYTVRVGLLLVLIVQPRGVCTEEGQPGLTIVRGRWGSFAIVKLCIEFDWFMFIGRFCQHGGIGNNITTLCTSLRESDMNVDIGHLPMSETT